MSLLCFKTPFFRLMVLCAHPIGNSYASTSSKKTHPKYWDESANKIPYKDGQIATLVGMRGGFAFVTLKS